MSDFVYTNSYILDPNPGPLSFTIGDVTDAQSFYKFQSMEISWQLYIVQM